MANDNRTFEIEDSKGRRRVTLAEFRADLDARKAAASLVMGAIRCGDIDGCTKAQAAMRAKFPL
jgi:hypothetical protein